MTALDLYGFLHLNPGQTIQQISTGLKSSLEAVYADLQTLWDAGLIVVTKEYRYYPVPLPLGPFIGILRGREK